MSKFPEELTVFLNKTNAEYDGDPRGDYILAEHMNKVQDAISKIEESIGLSRNPFDTLTERIERLELLEPMRIPSVGYFHTLSDEVAHSVSILNQYSLVYLANRTAGLGSIASQLEDTGIYGIVDATAPLSQIQNELNAWQQVGAKGVRLENFGGGANSTRLLENNILRSAKELKLNVVIHTTNWNKLLDNTSMQPYNPTGQTLQLGSDTIAELSPFAYDGRARSNEELLATTLPLVTSLRERNLKLLGFSQATTQDLYEWVHGAGLLFGIDYLYSGRESGESIQTRTPVFNKPSNLGNWRTDKPVLFEEGQDLVRRITDGAIRLRPNQVVKLDGLAVSSQTIEWFTDTVPGHTLKIGSLPPDRLSTYDVDRIVRLINESPEGVLIDPWKIGSSDGGFLPNSIPASNMIQNVIEAINKKNNINSTNKQHIESDAIKNLDASKLSGHLSKDQMINQVIQAVNDASSESVHINVPRIDAVNLNATGTIEGNVIVGDNLTLRAGNITESLTTPDLTISQWVEGNDGEFFRLFIQHLEVETLSGLKDLHVENLTSDNIGSLVLEAVEANISSGVFNTIVTQSLQADRIKADLVTALNSITENQITNSALFGEAVIGDAQIKNLSATKLSSGSINTSVINLSSDDGHLKIEDKTIRIYDDIDTDGNRRLRVILGATEDVTGDKNFGLVVLGQDGTTRLYDNTGVYNAGLHDNVISEEKIQDDAISERVIRAGAIHTDHLDADAITAGKIASDAILAKHILAGEIVGEHIHGQSITAGHLQAGSIETGHLTSGLIEAKHIKAGAITTEHLTIGFGVNLIREGFDSFEQEAVGPIDLVAAAGQPSATITSDWSYDGDKSLRITGNSSQNAVRLTKRANSHLVPVHPNNQFIVSAYASTEGTNPTPVRLGLLFNTGETRYSQVLQVTPGARSTRLYALFSIPSDALRANVLLSVDATNTAVRFDAIQVEEAEENQTLPGPYKSTATTVVSGDNIQTGRIDARHIHIGTGTVFGSNNDIIDITDEGIRARSQSGSAMLNSKGLEITGGAFTLKGGIGNQNVEINGQEGITVENSINRVEINTEQSFKIINKAKGQTILDIDPNTGDLRFSGTARFYTPGNENMAWSIEDKIQTIEDTIDNLPEPEVTQEMFDALSDQVDGSISTWFGEAEPTLNNFPASDWTNATERNRHLGDLYYDNETGYAYRFAIKGSIYQWKRIVDTDVTLALETASTAQAAADQKIRLFTTQPTPPYDIGDLWSGDGTNGDLLVAKTNRQTGTFHDQDWELATKYTDDTKALEVEEETKQVREDLRNAFSDTVDILSGAPELVSDKAQQGGNVFVEVDGKSYQHAGSGKNIVTEVLTGYHSYGGSTTTTEVRYNSERPSLSYLVEVEEEKEYRHSHMGSGDNARWFWFKQHPIENPSEISIGGNYHESPLKNTILKAPPEANWLYVVVTLNNETHPVWNIQLEEGSVVTEYEPPAPTPDYPIEIHSLNDFDIVSSVGRENLFSLNKFINAGAISKINNGFRITNSYGTGITSYIKPDIKPGKTYTISGEITALEGLSTSITGRFVMLSKFPDSIPNLTLYSGTPNKFSNTFKVPNDFNYSNYHGLYAYGISTGIVEFVKIKIEEGAIATPYSLSLEDANNDTNSIFIDKIKLSLSEPLRSVGDVKDRLFRDSDGLWKIERNIEEIVLDGSESWTSTSSQTFYFSHPSIGNIDRSKEGAISNKYKSGRKQSDWGIRQDIVIQNTDSNRLYFFTKKEHETLGDWINHLRSELNNNTPVVIHHWVASSVVETLGQELQDKLNNLSTFGPRTFLYTVTSNGLQPNLRGIFRSAGAYQQTRQTQNMNTLRESLERKVDIRLGMKIGYSNFTTASSNHVYLSGIQMNPRTLEEELVDTDGSLYIRDERQSYVIPKQSLNLSGVPAGTSGYIAWDNTQKALYFMWYEHITTDEGISRTRWRKINGDTSHLNESVFVLGELEIS